MSTFAPGVRPQYIAALKKRAAVFHGIAVEQRSHALVEVLELDGAGVIDLDELPALRNWFVASTEVVAEDIYMPRWWNGQHADSERPTDSALAVVATPNGTGEGKMLQRNVVVRTERAPKHGGDDFPKRQTGTPYYPDPAPWPRVSTEPVTIHNPSQRLSALLMGGVVAVEPIDSTWADVGYLSEDGIQFTDTEG